MNSQNNAKPTEEQISFFDFELADSFCKYRCKEYGKCKKKCDRYLMLVKDKNTGGIYNEKRN